MDNDDDDKLSRNAAYSQLARVQQRLLYHIMAVAVSIHIATIRQFYQSSYPLEHQSQQLRTLM